jgi:hypothetical protein
MTAQDQILERIADLIDKGKSVLATDTPNPPGVIGFPTLDHGAFTQWRTQTLAALNAILGEHHTYTRAFSDSIDKGYTSTVKGGIGILNAIHDDAEKGRLLSLQQIVVAEVFSDFLDMAKHLLDHGYKDAAALITGAVLEDGMRRIVRQAGLRVSPKDDLSALNSKCSQGQIYNNLIRKKIAVWTDIRNNAAHGKWDGYTAEDVVKMHEEVSEFLGKYLT